MWYSNFIRNDSIARVLRSILYLFFTVGSLFIIISNVLLTRNKTQGTLRRQIVSNHFVIQEYIKENIQRASSKLDYLSLSIKSIKSNNQYSSIKSTLRQISSSEQ